RSVFNVHIWVYKNQNFTVIAEICEAIRLVSIVRFQVGFKVALTLFSWIKVLKCLIYHAERVIPKRRHHRFFPPQLYSHPCWRSVHPSTFGLTLPAVLFPIPFRAGKRPQRRQTRRTRRKHPWGVPCCCLAAHKVPAP